MEANELRIGNYVNAVRCDKTEVVDNIKQIHENYVLTALNWGEVRPIALTEEWLVKFGFEKVVYPSVDDYLDEVCYELEYNKNGNTFFLSYADDFSLAIFSGKKYWRDEMGITPHEKDFEYVHQLQNLYFSLAGEELTIK